MQVQKNSKSSFSFGLPVSSGTSDLEQKIIADLHSIKNSNLELLAKFNNILTSKNINLFQLAFANMAASPPLNLNY